MYNSKCYIAIKQTLYTNKPMHKYRLQKSKGHGERVYVFTTIGIRTVADNQSRNINVRRRFS